MDIDEKMKKGFENLGRNLEIYLKSFDSSIKNYLLTIFGSVTLENGSIISKTLSWTPRAQHITTKETTSPKLAI